jgi:hypothetical protein
MKKILLALSVLLIGSGLMAQKEIPDFRGYKWGTPYDDMSGFLKKGTNLTPGFKNYVHTEEDFNFSGAKAHTISYLFKKDEFYGVNIGYFDKDFNAVLAFLTNKYGEGKAAESPMFNSYEWVYETTIMTLTKFNTGEEKNVALNIGIKRKGLFY